MSAGYGPGTIQPKGAFLAEESTGINGTPFVGFCTRLHPHQFHFSTADIPDAHHAGIPVLRDMAVEYHHPQTIPDRYRQGSLPAPGHDDNVFIAGVTVWRAA